MRRPTGMKYSSLATKSSCMETTGNPRDLIIIN